MERNKTHKMKPKKIAVIFGGTNTEHEVSIVSARSIIENLDKDKYTTIPIKITKDNKWVDDENREVDPISILKKVDLVFPVLHGPFGEDGTIQGLLEMIDVPYVGCGVLASAVCMDKVIQKQICQAINIPIAKYVWFNAHQWSGGEESILKKIVDNLEFPVFVKPANQGSSVGVSKADDKNELSSAINTALKFDQKIIIEQTVGNAREIECSVMGNHDPKASVLGEITSSNEFYDYDSKYIDGKSTESIPANLAKEKSDQIKKTAIDSYKILNCTGLARVDFLYDDKSGDHYLNELNTLPGFTNISMYPKLWKASGVEYSDLLDELIDLGFQRHQEKSQIDFNYTPKTNWHEK